MEEKKQKGSGFAWPSAAVVAALATVLVHNTSPLRSSRPDEKPRREHTAKGDQTVEARLWQDPFAAVAAHQAKEAELEAKSNSDKKRKNADLTSTAHTLQEVIGQIQRRTDGKIGAATDVTVFFVMLSNGPYIEDAERRMRTRYAVVSALSVANYVPWDEDRIGYFELHWPRGDQYETVLKLDENGDLPSMADSPGDDLLVPFEWFQPNTLAPDSRIVATEATGAILLLWLDSDALQDHPAKRLAQMMSTLKRQFKESSAACEMIRYKLLDPRLQPIFQETFVGSLSCQNCASVLSVSNELHGIKVYSSWSTTPDALLVPEATDKSRQRVAAELAQKGFQFFNATATDDDMTYALIQELAARGVDLSDPKSHIALVSESDTFYGRALPLTFAANVIKAQQASIAPHSRTNSTRLLPGSASLSPASNVFSIIVKALRTHSEFWPSNIHFSSYLRGVDGHLPGEVAAKSEEGQEKNKAKEAEHLERPEGPSQLDYMPRLARELREHEKEYEVKGESGFKA